MTDYAGKKITLFIMCVCLYGPESEWYLKVLQFPAWFVLLAFRDVLLEQEQEKFLLEK